MAKERRQFSMDVKVGDSVSIDRGRTVVTIMDKSGKQARLAFNVIKDISINKLNRSSVVEYAKKGLAT
jgi:hypothetical protein